jgi:hypothetical protein
MPAETSPDLSVRNSDSGRWGLRLQCLLVAGVFAVTFICLRDLVEIRPTMAKYREEFVKYGEESGHKPLPPVTEWVLQYPTIFLLAAIFVPMAALGTFALRDRWQACWVLVGLGLVSGFEALMVHAALRLPFIEIVKQMGGSAGP